MELMQTTNIKMISQSCPKCSSKRVRKGYHPTPLWSKLFFRYNLLCDSCNLQFTGFAVPGTVSAKPLRSPKKQQSLSKKFQTDEK
jgi:transposase-like protein